MICEHCGNDMKENIAICPVCGTLTASARGKIDPSTSYGTFPQGSFAEPQAYERGYTAQAEPPPAAAYTPPPYPQRPRPQQSPPAQQQLPYGYAQPIYNNYTIYNMPPTVTTSNGALVAEILFSLFGVFGVGWLIGGETATGVLLLIGSFVLYWPIIFGGTLITFGLGLICLGPLAIGLIILNALLLSNKLRRKATMFYIMQPPPAQPMQMPPRPQ